MNFHECQAGIILYDGIIFFYFVHRIAAHQKSPSIFQLLDQLENVAEKLMAE
jgi:hypothetical protein